LAFLVVSFLLAFPPISYMNVHATTEDIIDKIKDRFYEEPVHVFDNFPKYHIKILLGDFNTKVGRKIFLNLLFGMRVYTKLLVIMESE
jgi:hypothetical protein